MVETVVELKPSKYRVREQIYQGDNCSVYRAIRKEDERPVILKMLRDTYARPERIASFKREYEITRKLSGKGTVRVDNLETDGQRWFMVLEDFGGESLEKLGLAGKLDPANFLQLAIALADSLGQIHAEKTIHKNINPANILFNATTGIREIHRFRDRCHPLDRKSFFCQSQHFRRNSGLYLPRTNGQNEKNCRLPQRFLLPRTYLLPTADGNLAI